MDVSSIGSVADRNEMPRDLRCERSAKWSYLSRAKRVKLNTTRKCTLPTRRISIAAVTLASNRANLLRNMQKGLKTHRAAALLVVLAATASCALGAQSPSAPVVVAVWGNRDALIPFADFDGERWRPIWPEPVNGEVHPIPVEQIPADWWGRSSFQTTWETVETNGRRRRVQITGTTPTSLGSGCSINLGLTTDAPPKTFSHGSVLATNQLDIVEAIDTLTPPTPIWRTVHALLPDIYRRHEATAWKDVSAAFQPDLTAPLSSPRLDAAYAFEDDHGDYAYFESSREFARRADQRGTERSFITGWLWRPSATTPFQLIAVRSATNDEDDKSEHSLRPLGVVLDGSRRFWIGLLSGYTYTGLTVLDIRRAGVRQLLRVDYGGC